MIYVEELAIGRRPSGGDSPSNEVPVLCRTDGGETEEQVVAYLEANVAGTLGALKLRRVRVSEVFSNGWVTATLEYGSAESRETKETGESSFQFDTSGSSVKITQSIATIWKIAATGTAPDLGGAIGVSENGVEGVEITVPQYAFSETHYISADDVTNTYKGYLYSLTGKVNYASFKGCAAGECLFLGARGAKRGRGDWEITYSFAASPNKTGIQIGSLPTVDKLGWEYIWVVYQKTESGSGANKIVLPKPRFVYVEKVYDVGDFSLLGIGTT